ALVRSDRLRPSIFQTLSPISYEVTSRFRVTGPANVPTSCARLMLSAKACAASLSSVFASSLVPNGKSLNHENLLTTFFLYRSRPSIRRVMVNFVGDATRLSDRTEKSMSASTQHVKRNTG